MTRYAIVVVSPPGYRHSEAFREVALAIFHGMEEAGFDVAWSASPFVTGRVPIVLGANLIQRTDGLPHDAIVFNLEQVDPASGWMRESYLALLRTHLVWDYSPANIARLRGLGVTRIRHLPIGHVRQLERIEPAADKDIDVLFYGSMNPRRAAALEQVRNRGLRVESAFGVYGDQRDALIARARLVLNVHFYAAKVLEVVRIAYLLGNGACVVSEQSGDALESEFADAVAFAPYEDLAATCSDLLRRPDETARMSVAGRALMRARPQSRYVLEVLGPPEATATTPPTAARS